MPPPTLSPAAAAAAIRLDVRHALREGMPARHAAGFPVAAADLLARAPRLGQVLARLAELESSGGAGFLRLDRAAWQVDACKAEAARLREHADTLLLLGIGGSALGPRALDQAVGPRSGRWRGAARGAGSSSSAPLPALEVLDSPDPMRVSTLLRERDPRRCALAVISKSGGTVETGALFRVLQPWLEASVGAAWKERVLFVTDPRSGVLRALADESGLRSLPVPPDVGGRFSVQTAVGLLPAAFLGIDVDALLDGAEAMRERVRDPDAARNPAFSFASLHDAFWGHANVTVWMAYCDALRGIGEWFQQLWAESLGKHLPQGAGHYGWTPAVAQGPVDQHSQLQLYQEGPRDKIVTFVAVDEPGTDVALPALRGPAERLASYLAGRSLATLMEAERLGTMAALVDAGRPVVELRVPRVDESVIGALFVLLEQATAMAGLLRGVDPFDQPGVEFGKRFASGLLGRPEYAADAAKARALLGLPEDAGSRAAS